MKNTHIALLLVVAALPRLPAASAAETPEADAPIDMRYDREDREQRKRERHVDTCPVYLAPVEDGRQNTDTIGQSGRGALVTTGMTRWLHDGLLELGAFGFVIDDVSHANPPLEGVTVQTRLTRAYTWQVGPKIVSMIAVSAQFIDKNGLLQRKSYRVQGDKNNLAGADYEYMTTLNYGLNNLLPVMAIDLLSLCKGNKVQSYSYIGPGWVSTK